MSEVTGRRLTPQEMRDAWSAARANARVVAGTVMANGGVYPTSPESGYKTSETMRLSPTPLQRELPPSRQPSNGGFHGGSAGPTSSSPVMRSIVTRPVNGRISRLHPVATSSKPSELSKKLSALTAGPITNVHGVIAQENKLREIDASLSPPDASGVPPEPEQPRFDLPDGKIWSPSASASASLPVTDLSEPQPDYVSVFYSQVMKLDLALHGVLMGADAALSKTYWDAFSRTRDLVEGVAANANVPGVAVSAALAGAAAFNASQTSLFLPPEPAPVAAAPMQAKPAARPVAPPVKPFTAQPKIKVEWDTGPAQAVPAQTVPAHAATQQKKPKLIAQKATPPTTPFAQAAQAKTTPVQPSASAQASDLSRIAEVAKSLPDFSRNLTAEQRTRYVQLANNVKDCGFDLTTMSGRLNCTIQVLVALGWPEHQATGFASNFLVESRLDERAIGDSGLAKGFAQMHPKRRAALRRAGLDLNRLSLVGHIMALNYELRWGGERLAGMKIAQSATADAASRAVTVHYERPLDKKGQAHKRAVIANLIVTGQATSLLDQLKSYADKHFGTHFEAHAMIQVKAKPVKVRRPQHAKLLTRIAARHAALRRA